MKCFVTSFYKNSSENVVFGALLCKVIKNAGFAPTELKPAGRL